MYLKNNRLIKKLKKIYDSRKIMKKYKKQSNIIKSKPGFDELYNKYSKFKFKIEFEFKFKIKLKL